MRVLFAGGGSGGHFFPIIAVIRELKRIAEEDQILDLELFYMGPDHFGDEVLREEEVIRIRVGTGKIRRYRSAQNITDAFLTGIGILRGIWHMFNIMPDVIFSKGGYGALPAVITAILFRIPLIIHESDSIAGAVNRFSSRFASRISIAFVAAESFFPKEKTALVGIPIRKRILGGNRASAREAFDIYSEVPVVGIIGGSQGSQKINDALMGVIKEMTDEFEIVHQTGTENLNDVKGEASIALEFAHKERYHPFDFFDEERSRDFFAASDMIVSRAGASAIFEIAAEGKPSLVIPLGNSAQGHQLQNAYEYAAAGACQILEEGNLSPHILLGEVQKIASHPEVMTRMGTAAQRFARIDAAEVIAREILKLGLHKEKK